MRSGHIETVMIYKSADWLKSGGTSGTHLVHTHLPQKGHLEPVTQDHVQTAVENLCGRLHSLPGPPALVLSCHLGDEVFPNIQKESLVSGHF